MSILGKRTNDLMMNTHASKGLGLERSSQWAGDEYIPSTPNLPKRPQPANSERQVCANVECTSGWTMPWKNRRRPIFEGSWGCSTRCLQAIVRRALRRERGDVSTSTEAGEPHRHRIPLGLVMLAQGWITKSQLRQALDAQRSAGEGRIGDWLVQECGLNPAQVTRGLAVQWSCPVLPMDGFAPGSMALAVPRLFIEDFKLLPLRVAGSRLLYLAFADNLDAAAAFAVEQMSGLKVESGLLDDAEFQAARSRVLESSFVPVKQEGFLDTDSLAAKITATLERTQPIGARLVRVHQHYWLRTWLETGAYSGVGTLPASVEDVNDTIFTIGSHA